MHTDANERVLADKNAKNSGWSGACWKTRPFQTPPLDGAPRVTSDKAPSALPTRQTPRRRGGTAQLVTFPIIDQKSESAGMLLSPSEISASPSYTDNKSTKKNKNLFKLFLLGISTVYRILGEIMYSLPSDCTRHVKNK